MYDFAHIVGLLAVAGLFGSMLFFSVVVAPLVFLKLDGPTAAAFIREIFPWYYLVVAVLGFGAVAALVFVHPIDSVIMLAVAVAAVMSRSVLMPRINHHRDLGLAGDKNANRIFTRLHRLSVGINAVQLLACFGVLIRMAAES